MWKLTNALCLRIIKSMGAAETLEFISSFAVHSLTHPSLSLSPCPPFSHPFSPRFGCFECDSSSSRMEYSSWQKLGRNKRALMFQMKLEAQTPQARNYFTHFVTLTNKTNSTTKQKRVEKKQQRQSLSKSHSASTHSCSLHFFFHTHFGFSFAFMGKWFVP